MLNPAPLVQDLMAPTWRDPCLSCAYFGMVLAHPHFSRLAATYLSTITCTTHHDILWLVGGTPMTTWITDYLGTLTVIDSPKTCGPEQEPIKVSEREFPFDHLRCSTTAPHKVDHQWHALVFLLEEVSNVQVIQNDSRTAPANLIQ